MIQLIRSLNKQYFEENGCVITIGNFDGIHIGHQAILRQLLEKAKSLSLPAVVMTFLPSPEEFFRGKCAAPRLSSLSDRLLILDKLNIDAIIVLPFNQKLASTTAEQFVENILLKQLNAKYVLVGDDFKFGANKKGDFQFLKGYADRGQFELSRKQTIADNDARISSTRIRAALFDGELAQAKSMLGRNYSWVGRVIHGDKRGRQWGFPTLNLPVNRVPPFTGVFAVAVEGAGDSKCYGVANLGKRPTVGGLKTLLEVHLFDFSKEIYGNRICVEFVKKIRDEKKFDSFDALKDQIMDDCKIARSFFIEKN